MSKVLDYTMVSANADIKFYEMINSWLDKGWELYGHPFGNGAFNFNQAMVTREDPMVAFGFGPVSPNHEQHQDYPDFESPEVDSK